MNVIINPSNYGNESKEKTKENEEWEHEKPIEWGFAQLKWEKLHCLLLHLLLLRRKKIELTLWLISLILNYNWRDFQFIPLKKRRNKIQRIPIGLTCFFLTRCNWNFNQTFKCICISGSKSTQNTFLRNWFKAIPLNFRQLYFI